MFNAILPDQQIMVQDIFRGQTLQRIDLNKWKMVNRMKRIIQNIVTFLTHRHKSDKLAHPSHIGSMNLVKWLSL